MKKASQSIISAYYNAILNTFANNASAMQTFLTELNAILTAAKSVQANKFDKIDSQTFAKILSSCSVSKSTVAIISVIIANKRIQLLPILFERFVQKFSSISNKNIAIISCNNFNQFNEIKSLPFFANCVVFFNKTTHILDVNVKINNKIVDISIKSKINSLKNQAVKNIENLIN